MTHPMHAILIPILACALGQAQEPVLPVVMVGDLSGRILRGGGQPLTLAEGIPAYRGLTLGSGARLVVIHLKTGEELVFTGPGTVSFDAEGSPLGAKPASRRKVAALREGFRLEPGAWAQASVVMRKEMMPGGPFMLDAEEPMPFRPLPAKAAQQVWLQPLGTVIMEDRPEFRWRLPLSGLGARFRLTDRAGAQVCNVLVRGESLRLNVAQTLRPGGTYRWQLSWTLPDGQEQQAEGEFVLLAKAEAQLIRGLRPAQDASFSERLAFAVALESRGLMEEARPYWQRLAAERPGDATLQRFAGPS